MNLEIETFFFVNKVEKTSILYEEINNRDYVNFSKLHSLNTRELIAKHMPRLYAEAKEEIEAAFDKVKISTSVAISERHTSFKDVRVLGEPNALSIGKLRGDDINNL